MKTHTFNITARLLVLFVTILAFVPAIAQDNRQFAIYNYRNDGDINAFLYFEIDSITYSCIDTLGVEHEYVVVQEIWTPDKVYRILLENIDSISFRTPSPEMTEDLTYNRWTNVSVSEIEKNLQESCNNDDCDIDALVSVLNTNEIVKQTYSSVDSLSLIVRYKEDDVISVYPFHIPIDPFAETNDGMSQKAIVPTKQIRAYAPQYNYKETGNKGVVAVFNYFSNSYYGDDDYGSRTTQNMLLDYMCRELNHNDYGVEFYGYEEMTLSALKHVLNNASTYKAVVVISHGFSEDNQSFFLIGEEFNSDKARTDPFLNNEGYELPFKYKFWNNGLYGLKERYDFAVPVNKMNFGNNVLLYMGSCDAYRYNSDMKGMCIGWDGTNCCAQAHVALLFHKLLRGKNLYDALDLDDREFAYYSTTASQTDTWKEDLVYDKTHLKTCWDDKYNSETYYVGGGIAKKQWAQYPNYYKSGDNMPKILVLDASGKIVDEEENYGSSLIRMGVCPMKDHKFKLKFLCYDDLPGDYVWIKATPLRVDVAPIIKKINKNKLNKGFKIELEANGVYELSAAIDENFSKEILLHKPVVFVYAKPFKDNSIPLGEDEDLLTFDVNGVSFDMIAVEGGNFIMGSPDDDPDAGGIYSDETPQHLVTLDSYFIGETEVTQALWKAVMGNNPSIYKGDNLPVEEVSWEDCQSFISKLNRLTGRTFRMPTEAEWEYAARGGNNSKGYKYAGSNDVNEVAWNYDNCDGVTHSVATKAANELGLYDMSGNVWEWCQDWYDGSYYRKSPANNPCNTSQTSEYRIHRGGSIEYIIKDLRVAMRGDYVNPPSNRLRGLRLALSDGDGSPVGYLSCPDDRHPHLIDLGLPSGTKWACCNVGATKPEEYGGYYAWGETEEKEYYDWSTYKWCNGSYDSQTKYCTDSSYGTVDDNTSLDPEDDVAHVKWGGSWRMPTNDQRKELFANCSSEWTSLNGVNGRFFISPNGNSIFLPAGGDRMFYNTEDSGKYGEYWLSTYGINDGLGDNMRLLQDVTPRPNLGYGSPRYLGKNVRPVSE